MVLSDFLSRQDIDDSNPHEIIPISFSMRVVLQIWYYNLGSLKEGYMIQTRSQAKSSGVKVPDIHGIEKGLDPHVRQEKVAKPIEKKVVEKRPRLDQGRAGLRRRIKPALPITMSREKKVAASVVPRSKE